MEAETPSETLVFYHITAQCHNPEDNDVILLRRENLNSQVIPSFNNTTWREDGILIREYS
jgi:hypothetical protein